MTDTYLTPKEIEILELLKEIKSQREVSKRLGTTEANVSQTLRRVVGKILKSLGTIEEAEKRIYPGLLNIKNYKGGVLDSVFNSVEEAICIVDGRYRIVMVNQGLANLFKGKMKDFIRGHCYEHLKGRNTPCKRCTLIKSFKSGRSIHGVETLLKKDGTRFKAEVFAFPIKDIDGGIAFGAEYIRQG